jgi:hypothetical protein
MRNKLFILMAIGLLYSSFLIYSCKKDDNNDVPSTSDWIAVDQGPEWTSSARSAYYTEDQGTCVIPYSWLTSLKDPSGAFFLSGNLQRYGFLPISGRKLPVGFDIGRDTANILSVFRMPHASNRSRRQEIPHRRGACIGKSGSIYQGSRGCIDSDCE